MSKRAVTRWTYLSLSVIGIVSAIACGTSSSDAPGATTNEGNVAQKTVGAAGGTLATSDGTLTVAIPPGALGSDVTITIAEVTAPATGAIGKTYEIGPS